MPCTAGSSSVSAMFVFCLSVCCEVCARNLRADLDHLDCSDTQIISHTPSKAKMIFEKKMDPISPPHTSKSDFAVSGENKYLNI